MADPRRPRVDLIESHHRTERARHRRRRELARRLAVAAAGADPSPHTRAAADPADAVPAPPTTPTAPSGRGLVFDEPEPPVRRRRRARRGDPAIVRVNRHRAVHLRPTWRRMVAVLLLVVVALLLVIGVVAWYVAPDPADTVREVLGQWSDSLRDWVLGLLATREA